MSVPYGITRATLCNISNIADSCEKLRQRNEDIFIVSFNLE